jgi:hypothetical protein
MAAVPNDALPVKFLIEFAGHMQSDRVSEMAGTLAMRGDLEELDRRGRFAVTVSRASRLKSLKTELDIWQAHGFIRYRNI